MKRPQLSVRDLLWLVVVVGIGVAWWLDRSSLNQQINLERLRTSGSALDRVAYERTILRQRMEQERKAGQVISW